MKNKSLNLDFLKSKKLKAVPFKEAIKDVEPFIDSLKIDSLNLDRKKLKKGGFQNEKNI